MAGWGEGKSGAPIQDWQAKRYGIDIPDGVGNLRTAAAESVLSACQIPLALFSDADGTSQRESWRRFAMGPLAGLARIIEAEIADKLMTPVNSIFPACGRTISRGGRKRSIGLSRAVCQSSKRRAQAES